METFKRVLKENIIAYNGEILHLRNDTVLTSGVRNDMVVIFSRYWITVPKSVFKKKKLKV